MATRSSNTPENDPLQRGPQGLTDWSKEPRDFEARFARGVLERIREDAEEQEDEER